MAEINAILIRRYITHGKTYLIKIQTFFFSAARVSDGVSRRKEEYLVYGVNVKATMFVLSASKTVIVRESMV